MDIIGKQEIWSFAPKASKAMPTACGDVRKGQAHTVVSFMELAKKVAELQFRNRDFVLLFRGQAQDHKNDKKNTSLKPSLFRPKGEVVPGPGELYQRFNRLRDAERILVTRYIQAGLLGHDRLKRQPILRWSILQHYGICDTPLLDVTHSLRIAASFASSGEDEGFVFVLGVPHLSGAITASAEAGLQIVRLSSVCPPAAVRPHIQEGYLLGEYPDMTGFDQKQHYEHYEIDFGRRLVAKFRFDPTTFWKDDAFPKVGDAALYPDENDPLNKFALDVKRRLEHRY
jgi:hypothetical protein